MHSTKPTAGHQQWRQLSFIHWRVPAETLQTLLPDELTIQTFDGSAWLGFVPFSMERIRPWWAPPVPGISWFLETNIRTYVVDRRGVAGVWFFSLDANHRLAVWVARRFWHLPYQLAHMTLTAKTSRSGGERRMRVSYAGRRSNNPSVRYEMSAEIDAESATTTAVSGTLEHFLVERYLLFARSRVGSLMTGEVHHEPYRLRPVVAYSGEQSLTAAMGCPIPAGRVPDHVAFSDGVDVRVSPLTGVR